MNYKSSQKLRNYIYNRVKMSSKRNEGERAFTKFGCAAKTLTRIETKFGHIPSLLEIVI